MLRYLFFPKFSKKNEKFSTSPWPPPPDAQGGYQNLKIIHFELGDRSRVVRWASYLVGMQYPWVLQVGKRSDSSDKFILAKISILGRQWNQTVKWPISTPEPKIEILDSPDTIECSDHPRTVSTCATHGYYRLQEFQNRPITFHPKNLDFEGSRQINVQNTKNDL